MKKQIILATQNEHKIVELRSILKPLCWKVLTYRDINFNEEIEETGSTFTENALLKARAVVKHSGILTVADDSGLEVDFLGGLPGVKSARFISENASFEERNARLLELLTGVPHDKRSARFVCHAVLVWPVSSNYRVFTGKCEGQIGMEPAGVNGFGYDPVFFLPDRGKTMAELSPVVKNSISHRALAFKNLTVFLKTQFSVD